MIDGFYARDVKLGHFRCGPLAAHVDRFAGQLLSQGRATHTGRWKIRLVADFSTWLDRRHLRVQDLEEEPVDEFLKARKRQHLLRRGDRRTLTQLLRHQRQGGFIPQRRAAPSINPMDLIIRDYTQFLTYQWGLSQVYLHANLELKEKALAKTRPFNGKPGRYRPDDQLLAFLQGL
jgi:hypothetical protein